jgi:hypothetical protein
MRKGDKFSMLSVNLVNPPTSGPIAATDRAAAELRFELSRLACRIAALSCTLDAIQRRGLRKILRSPVLTSPHLRPTILSFVRKP